jgi:hypothetical protein
MITFAGFAFAGDHGISKIEVSTDGVRPGNPLSSKTFI